MSTRVAFPQIREAPRHVVEGLRTIDPTAELLWWGPRAVDLELPDGRVLRQTMPVWLLGTVRPNDMGRRAAYNYFRTRGDTWQLDTDRFWALAYQGFRAVSFHPMRDPTWEVVEDFRRRDWLFRCDLPAEERRILAATGTDRHLQLRQAKMVEAAQAEMPGIWHFQMGGRRSVQVG